MGRIIDLTGQRFGRLVALKRTEDGRWLCNCDCGGINTVRTGDLRNGQTSSCGCLARELSSKRATKHGMRYTPEYQAWVDMIQRCTNPKHEYYKNYGGRGITVCKRWLKFENFYADMGSKPTLDHSLERKKNNLGYSPENCIWDTRPAQANNMRSNRLITLDGFTQTLAQWCEELSLKYDPILKRLCAGWTPEEALLTPIGAKRGEYLPPFPAAGDAPGLNTLGGT
jgi:hypothetical protein